MAANDVHQFSMHDIHHDSAVARWCHVRVDIYGFSARSGAYTAEWRQSSIYRDYNVYARRGYLSPGVPLCSFCWRIGILTRVSSSSCSHKLVAGSLPRVFLWHVFVCTRKVRQANTFFRLAERVAWGVSWSEQTKTLFANFETGRDDLVTIVAVLALLSRRGLKIVLCYALPHIGYT